MKDRMSYSNVGVSLWLALILCQLTKFGFNDIILLLRKKISSKEGDNNNCYKVF